MSLAGAVLSSSNLTTMKTKRKQNKGAKDVMLSPKAAIMLAGMA
jgi:hypothetical protein